MLKKIWFALFAVGVVLPLESGCTRYFRVRDPSGNREYYTNRIGRTRTGGVQFRDLEENAEITLQSSEVKQIKREDLPESLRPAAK